MTLPANAHVESGRAEVFDKRFVGGWMVLGDADMGKDPACGSRVWASLKYYDEFVHDGKQVAGTTLKVWEEDIFSDGGFYTDWRNNGTPFKDFPGFLVPKLGPKSTIVFRRSYCIMVLGLSDRDPSKVLATPLAMIMFQLDIRVTGESVHVDFKENKSHAPAPDNWAAILKLTPVEKLPC
jgi:hypothetical protein